MSSRQEIEAQIEAAKEAQAVAMKNRREKEALLKDYDCCLALSSAISSTPKNSSESEMAYAKRVCAALMTRGFKIGKKF